MSHSFSSGALATEYRAWNDTATQYPDDTSVADLVTEQVRRHPAAVAVRTVGRTAQELTYGELDAWSDRLAVRLVEDGLRAGEPVGLLGDRCLAAPVAMLAIVKAGGAYVPLNPADPVSRVNSLIREPGIKRIVSVLGPGEGPGEGTGERTGERTGQTAAYSMAEFRSGPESGKAGVALGGADRAYVLFTSGSTGAPKAVAVPHRAIARLVINTNYVSFRPADRVANTGSPSFDASVFEIWGALLNGASLTVVDQATLLDPYRLEGFLQEQEISVLWLSAGVFHHSARARPGMFGPVRYLITGGDVLIPEAVAEVLTKGRPGRLVNGYGPTENTTFSATYPIGEIPHGTARIPIGTPVSNSTCYVIAEDGSLAEDGEEGELFVGGDGIALGYLNSPELTARRFSPDPFGRGPEARLYRTGDRVRRLADGNLDFLGRRDRMIKLRDFRIELDEVEAVLRECPLVGDAAVGMVGAHPVTKAIAAYYLPSAQPGQTPSDLRQNLAARLPSYMLPGHYIRLDHFPLTSAGKLDRVALAALGAAARTPAATKRQEASATEVGLARLWEEILDVPEAGPDSDFFDLGGNSLLAARVFTRLQAVFGVGLEQSRFLTRRLLEDSSLAACAHAVSEARTLSRGEEGGEPDFAREGRLDTPVPTRPSQVTEPPRRILLTGAAGFLGSHLLQELITRTNAHIYCLIRGANPRQRLLTARSHYKLGDLPPGRVTALPGDLSRPLLGLSPSEFDSQARFLDLILHCGAAVNFTYPYATLAQVTVSGTKEIIRLASAYRGIPVHFVSTLAILAGYGAAGIRQVGEDTPLAHPEHLHLGYTETKWVAEALLADAARQGLPTAVYRPYEVSGDTRNGIWNLESATCALFRVIADTGCSPNIDLPLDLVPVDVLARQIAHIATQEPQKPRRHATYHLANPKPGKLRDLDERLAAHGYPVQVVPLETWVAEAVRLVCAHPDHPFTPFVPLWVDRSPRSGLTVKEMFFAGHFPSFTMTGAEAALASAGIEMPAVDEALLDIYLRFFRSSGFLAERA
jgi:amino acid adenylation domain-containing protein/thioester reductase-like protein